MMVLAQNKSLDKVVKLEELMRDEALNFSCSSSQFSKRKRESFT